MNSFPHADVLAVLPVLERHIAGKIPLSMIRLGDGEGRLLGFPELVQKADLDFSLRIWFGRTDFDSAVLGPLALDLRSAVRAADIVGLPRASQAQRPEYRTVFAAADAFGLIAPGQILTDAAIHRYLQIGLFYRALLDGLPFCGLITCRDLAAEVARVFHIGRVEQWLVPGEARFPGPRGGEHFPARFLELRDTLEVPYRGAVFLVGAGALGKIYCRWIKERGGIALDIGSICDAWAGAAGRLRKPCHRLGVYDETPSLSLKDAIRHYNKTIEREDLGIEPLPE